MNRVLLVIMDGAGYDVALSECGWLEGAVALGQARRWKMHTALPSLSGPMYETIHTGLWPHQHGIVSNEGMRASSSHQLYVGQPWDPLRSVGHSDETADIQAARF
ncbi:alkaline phosphatase family protein [Tateyamaria pelophila]|uniref:alkaline phosphatase family protein n=1 Tax=Tateyamaria pelophila TaxID=328415 RepID=UPI001CBCA594|nr:alkaline phosphatase family protein [Tateyamaria pelophila]